jgi:hypothetical protein
MSKDVRFLEDTPYFPVGKQGEILSDFFALPSIENTNYLLSIVPSSDCILLNPDQQTQSSTASIFSNDVLRKHQPQTDQHNKLQSASDCRNPRLDCISESNLPSSLDVLLATRRVSFQTRQLPSRMQNYVTYNVRYPISRFISCH